MKRDLPSTPLSARGFTLVEVLFAMAIISIGLLGILGLQMSGYRSNSLAMGTTEATIIAGEAIELLENVTYSSLATCTSGTGACAPLTMGGRTFNRSWTVTPDPGGNSFSTVEVQVTWGDSWGKVRAVTLVTVRDG